MPDLTGHDRTGPWAGCDAPLVPATAFRGEEIGEELVKCDYSGMTFPISQTVLQGGRRIGLPFLKEPHPIDGYERLDNGGGTF